MRRIILLLFAVFVFIGCKTVYVPVDRVHTEYRDRLRRDSIYVKDSVYILERGDTVFFDRWHTEYVDRLRVDTVARVDSIRVPYPVEKIVTVEKELSWWQRFKLETGGVLLGAILLGAVYFVIKIVQSVKTGAWKIIIQKIIKLCGG
jgi:hypothetical protein